MKAVTIVSTKQFDAGADELLSADERADLEFSLAIDPEAHPTIADTSGVRKARWNRAGMGKRGGVRVIYFYLVRAELILLIAIYAKNVQENLTSDEKKQVRRLVKTFEEGVA